MDEFLKAHIAITGRTALLMAADSVEWSDEMAQWQKDHKDKSKAGDDRTPPWRWMGSLNYTHPTKGVVAMPAENLMKCIMEGASQVSAGKGAKTFKSQSQSGLVIMDAAWPIYVDGNQIPMSEIQKMRTTKGTAESFAEQKKQAESLGFELFVKRAAVNGSKHVRVRPRFDNWFIEGDVVILDDTITIPILQKIMEKAGMLKGIGNWRPSSKTPGSFGTFSAVVTAAN